MIRMIHVVVQLRAWSGRKSMEDGRGARVQRQCYCSKKPGQWTGTARAPAEDGDTPIPTLAEGGNMRILAAVTSATQRGQKQSTSSTVTWI